MYCWRQCNARLEVMITMIWLAMLHTDMESQCLTRYANLKDLFCAITDLAIEIVVSGLFVTKTNNLLQVA